MLHSDVVIVGGGLAGSAAAAMLARAGVDFVLIDPDATYPWDFRCEKIDTPQIDRLRQAGLADIVLPAATPIDRLHVARLGRFVHERENDQFGIYYDALVNRLRAEVPASRFIASKASAIATSPDRQIVSLANGQDVSARLVVLATGLNHALRKSLGIERDVLSANHSISIGFDIKPADEASFDFRALTYFPDRPSDPYAYLTLFPIGAAMRANFFVYHDLRDPWLEQFRSAPQATTFAALPGLRAVLGEFEVSSAIKVRPVDLYQTTGHRRTGVVLVGDAFATSCPAAGTGAGKVFTDVERLCNVYIPRWLASEGMAADKVAAFYDDPEKRASDAHSLAKARWLRSVSMDRSLRWRLRRLIKVVGGYGRGMLQGARRI